MFYKTNAFIITWRNDYVKMLSEKYMKQNYIWSMIKYMLKSWKER